MNYLMRDEKAAAEGWAERNKLLPETLGRFPKRSAWPVLVARLGDLCADAVVPPVRSFCMSQSRRYCLITPCRDEQDYARRTLEAVVGQTVRPSLWVIVDDGSKDSTPAILAEYAAKYPWIRVVTRADRGDRKLGGGVIDAFYAGYDTINPDDFDYVCKFDLDLDLPSRYFEILMSKMESEPRLGTCSGKPFFSVRNRRGNAASGTIIVATIASVSRISGFVSGEMWG